MHNRWARGSNEHPDRGPPTDAIHATSASREYLLDVTELTSREHLLVFRPHAQRTRIRFCWG